MKTFFENIVLKYHLGNLIEEPSRVVGGLTHKMYKLVTDKGIYVIKLLNPNIMKRPTALSNFEKANKYEKMLEDNHIPAIYALEFNGQKLQIEEGQYFYIFNWYDGKSLKDAEIKKEHCEKIGKILAEIHNITVKEDYWEEDLKDIDWNYYLNIAKAKESPIYDMLSDKIDLLNKSMKQGNEVANKLPNYITVCHNDLDSKNVMWINDEFKIIDLECLDYANPYLDLFTLALCWSGYETCNINFELFNTFINSYFELSKIDRNIDWSILYYANNDRLKWLEYNIKRSLMLETDSKEEQELGIKEVKETIEHVVYYDQIKDKLLENLSNFVV